MDRKPPKSLTERGEVYRNVLEEIRNRIRAVEIGVTDEFHKLLPISMASDFCALQLRKITECIAILCLLAHGETSKNIAKLYQADKLINALAKQRPELYLNPCRVAMGEQLAALPVEDPYLSRDELRKLYRKLHDRLHVGSILKRKENAVRFSQESIVDVLARLKTLVDCHYVQFDDDSNFVLMGILGDTTERKDASRVILFANDGHTLPETLQTEK